MTARDLEQAIEISHRMLLRRKFNEQTSKPEYNPPLTDEELAVMHDADQAIYVALAFRNRIYTQLAEPERILWENAMRNVYKHVNSKLYQEAAEDVLRTKYDHHETAHQDNTRPQRTT